MSADDKKQDEDIGLLENAEERDWEKYRDLFTFLGLDVESVQEGWNKCSLSNMESYNRVFFDLLDEMQVVFDKARSDQMLIQETLSPEGRAWNWTGGLLGDWSRINLATDFAQGEHTYTQLKKLLRQKKQEAWINNLQNTQSWWARVCHDQRGWNNLANAGMLTLYIGFNTATLLLLGISLMPEHSLSSIGTNVMAQPLWWIEGDALWNYGDSALGIVGNISKWKKGEKVAAGANFFNNAQLGICTLFGNLAGYGVIEGGASAAVGLLGFTFGVSMLIPAMIECFQAKKCQKRMDAIEMKLSALRKKLSQENPVREEKIILKEIKTLEEYKMEQKVERNMHRRSAEAWGYCAVGMTAIAILSFVALSGVSFGAVPAVMVSVIGFTLIAGYARKWWVDSHKKKEEVKVEIELQKRDNNKAYDSKANYLGYFEGKKNKHEEAKAENSDTRESSCSNTSRLNTAGIAKSECPR